MRPREEGRLRRRPRRLACPVGPVPEDRSIITAYPASTATKRGSSKPTEITVPVPAAAREPLEHVLATLDTVLPYADHPGMRAALVALGEVARKQDGDAHWLRQQHQARGSLGQVVRLACEQWAAQ